MPSIAGKTRTSLEAVVEVACVASRATAGFHKDDACTAKRLHQDHQTDRKWDNLHRRNCRQISNRPAARVQKLAMTPLTARQRAYAMTG
jgi:hypothetical protein